MNVMIIMGTEEKEMSQVTVVDLLCANGETPASIAGEAIPCQAAEDFGSAEGVETRDLSSNNNDLQERPTPHLHDAEGEDIVRYPRETLGVGLNSPRNKCEEFNRLLAYSRGGARAFDLGWMTEGDLPEEEDSTYERIPVNGGLTS